MRLFSKFVLLVVVTSILTSIACAEFVYVTRRSITAGATDGVFERRGSDTTVDVTYDTDLGLPQGIAFSPDGGTVYRADSGTRAVTAYNVATGDQIGVGPLFTVSDPIRGIAVDSAGDIYCAAYKKSGSYYTGWIEKYDVSAETLDASWGSAVPGSGVHKHPFDLEVYGGRLYASLASCTLGVWSWDLSGTTAVVPEVLGGTTGRFVGIAFAPDDTLYTVGSVDNIVQKWVSSDNYTNPTTVATLTRVSTDMDYFDGSLYVASRYGSVETYETEPGEIKKIDLSTSVVSTWVVLPTLASYPQFLAVTEVPEPSALALLATGLIGLLAYAWRKRK